MDATLVTISSVSLALVPVVMAITQIFKMWVLDSRWAPIVAIVSGIVLAFAVPQTTPALTVLQGILIGLTASGLFTGARATFAPTPEQ